VVISTRPVSVALAFALAGSPAMADFQVDLGSGSLAGGEIRSAEVAFDGYVIGFEIAFDYTPNAGSWASDLAFWIEDPAGHPSVQIGGYDVLFADEQGGDWGFDGSGSAQAGSYLDTQAIVHEGSGMWRFSIGNGWNASPGAVFDHVTITVLTAEFASCGAKLGACGAVHGGAGCDEPLCCGRVCAIDPACCDAAWDAGCVEAAESLCGLYVYECAAGGPANDCPTNATAVADGDTIAFSTSNANSSAPAGCEDYDPPLHADVWYRFTADSGGLLVASTCGTANFDTKLRGYDVGDGSLDPNTLPERLIACNDEGDGCAGYTSTLAFQVDAGMSYLVAVGGFEGDRGTGTVSFSFVPTADGCGDPSSGSCCEARSLGYCADASCCETVCTIDPACCLEQWDALCANFALEHCSPLCGEVLAAQSCAEPGAQPIASNFDESLATRCIACQAAGISFANIFARTFSRSELGGSYAFGCLDFGLDNSGHYLEGEIGVWIDPDGGAPSFGELIPLQSIAVGLYHGAAQLVTASGEPMCVELEPSQTLVVTLSIPPSSTGFATGAGGAASDGETWLLANDCGLGDFVSLSSLGFSDRHWFVRLSGSRGCGEAIPGDLNLDGLVDGADLGILLLAWGTDNAAADLDRDGLVDGADLGLLLLQWSS
jgi:hypothetical protein